MDPEERLHHIGKQIKSLWKLYQDRPIFGLRVEEEETELPAEPRESTTVQAHEEDDLELIIDEGSNDLTAALSRGMLSGEEIIYDEYLGLAIEPTANGISIKELWEHCI